MQPTCIIHRQDGISGQSPMSLKKKEEKRNYYLHSNMKYPLINNILNPFIAYNSVHVGFEIA